MMAALTVCAVTSIALADDIKTIYGKEYKNATVSRVEPDGIVIRFSGGIVKLPFADLPEETRNKYHYKPDAVKAYAQDQIRNEAEAVEKWNAVFKRIQEGRARYWNVTTYTLQQLEPEQFYLIGKVIAVTFTRRSENTRRIDDGWFEGNIWCYDPGNLTRASYHQIFP